MFDAGKLIEMGTHKELLQIENGRYAHIYKLQSEGYASFNKNMGEMMNNDIRR